MASAKNGVEKNLALHDGRRARGRGRALAQELLADLESRLRDLSQKKTRAAAAGVPRKRRKTTAGKSTDRK